MKATQVASVQQHRRTDEVSVNPQVLARVASQLQTEFGHGVEWRSGAAYLVLVDMTRVTVPQQRLRGALARYGQYVWTVNGRPVPTA